MTIIHPSSPHQFVNFGSFLNWAHGLFGYIGPGRVNFLPFKGKSPFLSSQAAPFFSFAKMKKSLLPVHMTRAIVVLPLDATRRYSTPLDATRRHLTPLDAAPLHYDVTITMLICNAYSNNKIFTYKR
jgi:hypothetical protein